MTDHAEARVPCLARDNVEDSVKPTFDAFVKERGVVPNLFRVAAHRPVNRVAGEVRVGGRRTLLDRHNLV